MASTSNPMASTSNPMASTSKSKEPKMKVECSICANEFLQTITCPKCDLTTCRTCIVTFMDSKTNLTDIPCMTSKCNHIHSMVNLSKAFSTNFVTKTIWPRFSNGFFELQKTYIPETTAYMQYMDNLKDIEQQIQKAAQVLKELRLTKREMVRDFQLNGLQYKEEQTPFVAHCQYKDCKGLLNHTYECTLCKRQTCKSCFQIKQDDNHECNPDDVNTADTLRKTTKRCPNPSCGEPIEKEEKTCNQIFCTTCKMIWCYKKEVEEIGSIHNPHALEYMRKYGSLQRNPNDILCGGLPGKQFIANAMFRIYANNLQNYHKFVFQVYRYHEFTETVRDGINLLQDPTYANTYQATLKHRIKWMNDLVSDEKFQKFCMMHHRKKMRAQELEQILRGLALVLEDQMRTIRDANNHDDVENAINDIHRICDLYNTTFEELERCIKMKIVRIDNYNLPQETNEKLYTEFLANADYRTTKMYRTSTSTMFEYLYDDAMRASHRIKLH